MSPILPVLAVSAFTLFGNTARATTTVDASPSASEDLSLDLAYRRPVARRRAAPARTARRHVDRTGSYALGIRAGSYLQGYANGTGSFADLAFGIAGRYRAAPALGFELEWSHAESIGRDRITNPFSLSAQVFGYSWTLVNPYATVGLTWAFRDYKDPYTVLDKAMVFTTNDIVFGPHAGLGVEVGVGPRATVNLEARMVGYLNQPDDDPYTRAAMQTELGFNFYF